MAMREVRRTSEVSRVSGNDIDNKRIITTGCKHLLLLREELE